MRERFYFNQRRYYMSADLFPWEEVKVLAYGQELTKHDKASGRTITLTSRRSSFLKVEGRGCPTIAISCDGDDVNRLARCLLTGQFQ